MHDHKDKEKGPLGPLEILAAIETANSVGPRWISRNEGQLRWRALELHALRILRIKARIANNQRKLVALRRTVLAERVAQKWASPKS
jgi:hypothetical protein